MNADTNDTYSVQDMFQTVVTPKDFSTTQSQHNQLPDIHTMPKLDKEAIYLFFKEQCTEQHKMNRIRDKYIDDRHLGLGWGNITYSKYDDGLLEFQFIVRNRQSNETYPVHFFQDKEGKFYTNIPSNGKRTLAKQWCFDKSTWNGTVTDYKNNIKWSGNISNIYGNKNTLEYTETTNMKDGEHQYRYKAEFGTDNTPYGRELKFKATHVSTVNGKSGKPIVTETVYKGDLLALLHDLGLYKGVPLPMKTFKTIIRD